MKRAVDLERERNVVTHSAVLRLLLASDIMVSVRILPEGYEVIGIQEFQQQPSDRLKEARERFDKFNNGLFDEINNFKQ